MSLLGFLFDESEVNGTSSNDGIGKVDRDCSAPPPKRPPHGFCGIQNQGATCYLNALLQILAMTPEFRESLFHVGMNELGCLKDKDKLSAKVRIIPIHLQQLIARLLLFDVHAVKTAELTESFGWTNNEEREQHDVQELNRILFSAIDDSLIGTSGEKLIRNLYHGTIVNQIKCEECGKSSETEEDFLDLCVTVAGSSGLEESLTYSFLQDELLNKSNRYCCSNCLKLTNAVKSAKLRHLPPILTVSILRFNFDIVKMERYKETGIFVFPMHLNMAKYSENIGGSDYNAEYELFSIVIHRGSTHGGHYHAYIRDIDSLGRWIHPEEEEFVLYDTRNSQLDVIECDSCQSVLRTILLKSGKRSGMTIDALCAELLNQTGMSWNKRFKKQHGPITKFLKKNDDQFIFNQDANWVSLTEHSSSRNEGKCAAYGDMNQESKHKSKRPISPAPDPGHCWFDFDDSHVHPIRFLDIEKQFSGKECAYMLFYRSQSLIRPSEARHNPSFGIPKDLVCDIDSQNMDLYQQRSVYETQINMVSLEVHLSQSYFYSGGSLHPSDSTCSFVTLLIDKRKTVSDFLFTLMEEVNNDHIKENQVIHIAKEIPAGLHLYQNITDDLGATLVSYGIGNSTKVFLWNGYQVGGETVATGFESEPVLLNIVCSNYIQFSCGYAKNMTLGDLKESISLRSGIPFRNLKLTIHQDVSGGDVSSVINMLSEDYRTLSQAKLNDFDCLYAMDTTSIKTQDVKPLLSKRQLLFRVENHCLQSKTETDLQTVCVKVDKECTIEELKVMALSQFTIHDVDPSMTRIRIGDDGLEMKPALYEHETVAATNLTDGLVLRLESGKPPRENEITLFIAIVKTFMVKTSFELSVEKKMKVSQLVQLVISSADLKTPDWHLCRLNWNGDPAEVLDNDDLSLEDSHLNHGDHLSLQCGCIPPKGYIQLYIYLHQNISSSQQLLESVEQISTELQEQLTFSSNEEIKKNSQKSLGTIVISKLATLVDLKEQIMTLDGLSAVCIPTAKFLRLRVLHSKQPGPILRQHLQTLQKLKLVSGYNIGVQVLNDEEDLSQNEILLEICLRYENERCYLEGHELVWDVSQGATLSMLRQSVANIYQLSEQDLLMAKHLKEKYEWIILTEHAEPKIVGQNGKVKKKRRVGSDLRKPPFHLQDGDVIGVKVLLKGETVSPSDFETTEDDTGKEKLKKEADDIQKKKEANRRKNNDSVDDDGTIRPNKRHEVAIKIHVDSFL